MQLGDARTGKLADNIAAFGRALRRAGVPMDSSRIALAQTAAAGAVSAAPAPSAPVLASTMAHSCAACHGTNGQLGDESFAPLAGMPAGQFVKTMTDFREGRRPATLMGHVAKGFSDEDLKGMGAFFAAQKGAQ